MPDYSLQRNTPTQKQTSPQHQTQSQPVRYPAQQPDPMTQLSQTSDMAKKDTQIALLQEALATLAQNSEASTKELVTSQKEFHCEVRSHMLEITDRISKIERNTEWRMEQMTEQIEIHHLNNQGQLQSLQSTNQLFSQSLSDAVTETTDKIMDVMIAYVNEALQGHTKIIDGALEKYQSAFDVLADHVDDNTGKLKTYGENLQQRLDTSAENYNSSISELFMLNSREKKFFYAGIFGGIFTPVVLLTIMFIRALMLIFG